MEPERLEGLLNTEHHDATMATLRELVEKQSEFNHQFYMLGRGLLGRGLMR